MKQREQNNKTKREMTKKNKCKNNVKWLSSAYFGERKRRRANFSYFNSELNAGVTYLAWASSESNGRTQQI